MTRLAAPLLVTVTICTVERLPTGRVPNDSEEGLTKITGVDPEPVPLNATVLTGVTGSFDGICKVAFCRPVVGRLELDARGARPPFARASGPSRGPWARSSRTARDSRPRRRGLR
jgi:hypothetical protein